MTGADRALDQQRIRLLAPGCRLDSCGGLVALFRGLREKLDDDHRELSRHRAYELGRRAGFGSFRRVPLDNPFNILYEATL